MVDYLEQFMSESRKKIDKSQNLATLWTTGAGHLKKLQVPLGEGLRSDIVGKVLPRFLLATKNECE